MTDEEKEKKKKQIQQEINTRQSQINNLNNKKSQYQSMKKQINQALPKLKKGVSNIQDAQSGLKKTYTGQPAQKKNSEFQALIDENNATINKINNNILPEIEKKISNINSQISSQKKAISNLQYQLYTL